MFFGRGGEPAFGVACFVQAQSIGGGGDVWEDVMSFALQLAGKGGTEKFEAVWVDPQSVSEEERLNSLVLKQQLGVSTEQLLSEAGYGDDDLTRMMEEKQAALEAQQKQFDAGNTGDEF